MKFTEFKAYENPQLIEACVKSCELPEGIQIRTVNFDADISLISNLPLCGYYDRMLPQYGMCSETDPDQLTLIATRGAVPVGQISLDFNLQDAGRNGVKIKCFVTGIFVSDDERKTGIARSLASVAVKFCEAWACIQISRTGRMPYVEVELDGDAEPDSGGQAILNEMIEQADEITERYEELSASAA